MITETSGNLLRDPAQALVNTVNTVGVMGKGIALQFKRAFPAVFADYAQACADGRVRPGRVFPVRLEDGDRWVLNFPTKRHWRENSRMDDIRTGLDDLARLLVELDVRSVAIPPLGCGNGGLRWSEVRPVIFDKLSRLDIDIRLYRPGTPDPHDMVSAATSPRLTPQLNGLIAGLARYVALAFQSGVTHAPRLSLIEAHKVVYLLQKSGFELGHRFEPHLYGPFSADLNRTLGNIEGHYLMGYGDGTGGARADLEVVPEAVRAAETAMGSDVAFNRAWDRVSEVIIGYEYPDGMELLATVHYLATKPGASATTTELAEQVAAWSPRKRDLFNVSDVGAALARLSQAALVTA